MLEHYDDPWLEDGIEEIEREARAGRVLSELEEQGYPVGEEVSFTLQLVTTVLKQWDRDGAADRPLLPEDEDDDLCGYLADITFDILCRDEVDLGPQLDRAAILSIIGTRDAKAHVEDLYRSEPIGLIKREILAARRRVEGA